MKKASLWFCSLMTCTALFVAINIRAQGTAFTYQGRLTDGGNAGNGMYDLQFTLYAGPLGGIAIAGPVTNAATAVSNGLFATTVDFGVGVFTGEGRWLDIGVRTNGSANNFTPVTLRQPITATPYAIFSSASGSLSNGLIQNPQFFGTTGTTPLELFAGGERIMRLEPSAVGAVNVIGGSSVNQVDNGVFGATIAGGGFNYQTTILSNRVADGYGSIGGGYGNFVNGFSAVIAGGALNAAEGYAAAIAGGYGNNIQVGAGFTSIGGGILNVIGTNAQYSHVSGGYQNVIQRDARHTSVVGGERNTNGASHSFLGGGVNNWIEPSGDRSVIGGGWLNFIQGGADESVVAGGNANKILNSARESFIGGGFANNIGTNSGGSFLGGGVINTIGTGSPYSTIGGGDDNSIQDNARQSVIGGGTFNLIRGSAFQSGIMSGNGNSISNGSASSTIVGGAANHIGDTATYASIGGGNYNTIRPLSHDSTIGGGLGNRVFAQSQAATIAGGRSNAVAGFGFVGGGDGNTNRGFIATIGGGRNNQIGPLADHSVIAGGGDNEIVGAQNFPLYGTISGGQSNSMQTNAIYSTIGGGAGNTIRSNAQYATIPGGASNAAGGRFSFAAGRRAQALHDGSFVWADSTNADFTSSSSNQFLIRASGGVGIGVTNPAAALEVAGTVRANAFEGGNTPLVLNTTGNQPLDFKVNGGRALRLEPTAGSPNVIGGFSGNYVSNSILGATIAGGGANGNSNAISANYSAVGGGYGNVIEKDSVNSTIPGGRQNRIGTSAFTATIGGGDRNVIEAGAWSSTIAGGGANNIQASAHGAAIGGGGNNAMGMNADYSVIAGGLLNTNLGYASVIGGGVDNHNMGGTYITMGGGWENTSETNSFYGVIGGGRANQLGQQSFACAILSGYNNVIQQYADSSVIGGGRQNQIDQFTYYASLLGGSNNVAHGNFSAVGGGRGNRALGAASVVPGGSENTAWGDNAFAGGYRATANHQGCFVWADSQGLPFSSLADNQFLVRANFTGINRATPVSGAEYFGVRAPVTNAYGGMYMETAGVGLPFYGYAMNGIGFAWTYLDGTDGNKWKLYNAGERVTVTPLGNVGINNNIPTESLHVVGNILATGTITPNSDRNAKTDFASVDTEAVLDRVAKLSIQQWRFKTEAENVKHVGPMAQDFRAAFGLGAHETAIATVDADGVALAAIQGLHRLVKEKDAKIADLEQRLTKVERMLSKFTGDDR